MSGVEWTERNRERLEIALNEASVVGLRPGDATGDFQILLEVSALPESGPIDRDSRRVMVLHGGSELRFVLRRVTANGRGRALPLAGLGEVESFFASLAWGDSMYGWRFFDEPSLTVDWPSKPSLQISTGEPLGSRTFYWFNECMRVEGADVLSYCL